MSSTKKSSVETATAASRTRLQKALDGALMRAKADMGIPPVTPPASTVYQVSLSTTSSPGTVGWAYVPLVLQGTSSPSATTTISTAGLQVTAESSAATSAALRELGEAFNRLDQKVAKMELLRHSEDDRVTDYRYCPRCLGPMEGYPALSRVDNQTDICSGCGVDEAMESLAGGREGLTPIAEWPVDHTPPDIR